jgi:RHS repeat-associated protein
VGNRVLSTTTTAGGTHHRYDFDGLYRVTDGDAVKIVYDESSPIALIRSDGSGVVFHKDHLGSHTAESDLATGLLLAHQDYHPFGTPSGGQALAGPFGFSGELTDLDDGLVYFGGRYYLPEVGRFLTPDPSFLLQQPDRFFRAPRSLHLYAYVLNDPLNMIDPYGLWFGIDDVIAAAVGFVAGVAAYAINTAISGGSFSWQEALFSGLAGAASLWLTYSTFGLGWAIVAGAAMLAKPAICGALDKAAMGGGFGDRLLGFFSFAIKFASSPITSTIGLLIGAFGTGFGLWGRVQWFKGGVLAFEYSPGTTTMFSAVTLGATVNIWQGNTTNPSFLHELYHSRQYTYFGDLFVPTWVLGGVWGLLASTVAGKPQWGCFPAANPSGTYGNPLEATAESIDAGSLCT